MTRKVQKQLIDLADGECIELYRLEPINKEAIYCGDPKFEAAEEAQKAADNMPFIHIKWRPRRLLLRREGGHVVFFNHEIEDWSILSGFENYYS